MKIKNPRIVIYSIIALGFIALTFFISYWFLVGAIVLMILNQRELMRKKKLTQSKLPPETYTL
jgi:hypothetical protein